VRPQRAAEVRYPRPSIMARTVAHLALALLALSGCSSEEVIAPSPAPHESVFALAGGCFAVGASTAGTGTRWLHAAGETFDLADGEAGAARFYLKPSDLGTYLL
jgi:hypothetical protein